jgi:hypothetical protein
MTLPGSNTIPLEPSSGTFTVDPVTNLSGGALGNIIDIDQGFQVSGTVALPNWLSGNGQVCIYAEELGGPINAQLGCVPVPITPSTTDPSNPQTYPWIVSFSGAPGSPPLPDPQPGDSQLYHLGAVFTYGSQLTDIQSFVDMGMYMVD